MILFAPTSVHLDTVPRFLSAKVVVVIVVVVVVVVVVILVVVSTVVVVTEVQAEVQVEVQAAVVVVPNVFLNDCLVLNTLASSLGESLKKLLSFTSH